MRQMMQNRAYKGGLPKTGLNHLLLLGNSPVSKNISTQKGGGKFARGHQIFICKKKITNKTNS